MEYKNLWLCHLTAKHASQTCGYWYTVTNDHMAHTAFVTEKALRRWLRERGLTVDEIPERGKGVRIKGRYHTEMVWDRVVEFSRRPGLHTRAMSNGDYTLAIITEGPDGIRTVYTLNPNVKGRPVYNYQATRKVFC